MGTMADIGESLGNAAGTDVSTLVGERHPHFVTELTKPVIAAINGSCVGYRTHSGPDVRCPIRRGRVRSSPHRSPAAG